MQAEPITNLSEIMRPMMRTLARNSSKTEMLAEGNAFIYRFPPQQALLVASGLSFANPFFLPAIPDSAARDLELDIEAFAEFTMRAKLTARHADQPNIVIAGAPESGSSSLQAALIAALDVPSACLFTATLDRVSATHLGADLREEDPDELSLIRNGLNQRGYVAQHRMRCTPYMASLLDVYGVKPIVTFRNIADTIVGIDDTLMQSRAQLANPEDGYFIDGMPSSYATLPREDRLMILAQRWTPWLVQFYLTWKRCELRGMTKPLWISYEQDFLGDRQALAERLAAFVGRHRVEPAVLAAALEHAAVGADVVGRGSDLPSEVREHIDLTAGYYADDEDLTPLLGR